MRNFYDLLFLSLRSYEDADKNCASILKDTFYRIIILKNYPKIVIISVILLSKKDNKIGRPNFM